MVYGIIGASGVIGSKVSEYLENRGKNILKAGRHYSFSGNEYCLDVYKEDEVRDFVSKCDVVINCSGPSMKTSKRILPECLNQGKDYIDAFGWMPDITKVYIGNCRVVLNAGMVPGLPGILAAYMKNYGVEKLIFYSGGLEEGSRASLEDMLETSINGYSKPGFIVENGELKRLFEPNLLLDESINLPEECEISPLYTAEIEEINNILGFGNIENYNIFPNKKMRSYLMEGCMKYSQAKSKEEQESVIEDILGKLKKVCENKSFWYRFYLKAVSEYETQVIDIKTDNSAVITSTVIGHIAKRLCEKKFDAGFYRPFEIADGQELLDELQSEGIDINIYGEI